MIGMARQVVACAAEKEKEGIADWLRAELSVKQFPEPVINAIVSGAQGSRNYRKIGGDFEHLESGKSHLYEYAVWIKEKDDTYADICIICVNASFETAKVIERFE